MKPHVLWNARLLPFHIFFFTMLLLAANPQQANAQCASAPIAAAACSGGNGAATNGVNINSGNVYWVNTTTTLATVNLSGGTLRVCGSLTITTLNFNSGNLIVENGGSLNITTFGSSNLNGNVVFINRGSINITSSITFQNSGNYIYNDLSTSYFAIAGTVTVNSGGLTLINRGDMSISSLYYQGAAGSTTTGVCLGPQSVTSIYSLTNVTTNSFTESGASAACLNISGSATLTAALTSSSAIHVCMSGTESGAGGWGSAKVTTGCTSCASVLPLWINGFTATKQGSGVQLQWNSGVVPGDNGVYYAEKSTDGVNFETFATVNANPTGSSYAVSDLDLTAPKLYYRVRAVINSITLYSPVVLVETATAGQFQLYPNPAGPNTAITLVIPVGAGGQARLSLIDMAGEVLGVKTVSLAAGQNTLSWNLPNLAAGLYVVRIDMADGSLYGRLAVTQR